MNLFTLQRSEGVPLLIFNISKPAAKQKIITLSLLVSRQTVVGTKPVSIFGLCTRELSTAKDS